MLLWTITFYWSFSHAVLLNLKSEYFYSCFFTYIVIALLILFVLHTYHRLDKKKLNIFSKISCLYLPMFLQIITINIRTNLQNVECLYKQQTGLFLHNQPFFFSDNSTQKIQRVLFYRRLTGHCHIFLKYRLWIWYLF